MHCKTVLCTSELTFVHQMCAEHLTFVDNVLVEPIVKPIDICIDI